MISRRRVAKLLAGLPLVGAAALTPLATRRAGVREGEPSRSRPGDLFRELGVPPVINARGTATLLSGTLMLPEVVEALESTAGRFARLEDVQDAVGGRIAGMLGAEAAMVTSGAAAALTLGAAAAITGKNPGKIRQIPNLPGPRPEVVIQSTHRFPYDHAVRSTGARLVEVKDAREMAASVNGRTVMALFVSAADEHLLGAEEFAAVARRHGVPVMNDVATDIPPAFRLSKPLEQRFDLVAVSGGKALRGPQSTGLLYGRKDLVEAARLNGSPHPDTIGRGMKVNKEEMFALYVALESYLERDHAAEWREWSKRARRIASEMEKIPGVECEAELDPETGHNFPEVHVRWSQRRVRTTPWQVAEALRAGEPSVEVALGEESLKVRVATLEPEEVDIVVRRLREELEKAV